MPSAEQLIPRSCQWDQERVLWRRLFLEDLLMRCRLQKDCALQQTMLASPQHPPLQQPAQPIIPGLPDDLGLQCLLRSSRLGIPHFRLVCRKWHEVLCDPQLFALRVHEGLGEEWLYMCVRSKRFELRFDWYCFVPSRRTWLLLPPMPLDNQHGSVRTTGFGVTAVDNLGLFIAGGSAQVRGLLHVTVFDFRSGQWEVINDRSFSTRVDPVVASLGSEVYIAGGKDGSQYEVVDSMLAIDACTQQVTSLSQETNEPALVWCETLKYGQQLYARSRRDCLFGIAAGGGVVFGLDNKTKEWFQCPSSGNFVSKA